MFSRATLSLSALAFLCVALSTGTAHAATYYVSKTGSDASGCTQSLPCVTITRAKSLATQAGDIVQVAPGTYNERVNLTASGSSGAKITFRGHDGSGCPATTNSDVNAPRTRPNPSVSMQGFAVNANYIRIECFRVENSSGAAIDIGDQNDIDVSDIYVNATNGSPGVGVEIASIGPISGMASNVNVDRIYVTGAQYGFLVHCERNCSITNSEVFRLMGGPALSDHDYSRVFGDQITFRGNYFHGNRVADCGGDCHIDCWQSWNIGNPGERASNVTLDRNTCFNSHQGVIVRDTTSNTAGTYNSHYNWTITNNLFAYGPIGAGQSWNLDLEHVGNVVTYNNTFVGSIVGYVYGTRAVHKNNIHYNAGWMPYSDNVNSSLPGQITASGKNLIYESGRTYTGYSGDILNVNPLFVNVAGADYRLQSGSPAKDAGENIASVTVDRDGRARPQGPTHDIGAFEFGSTTAPLPPTNLQVTVR